MDADDRVMTWTVTGTEGSATSPAFAVPHLDSRLLVTRNGQPTEEVCGDGRTSYTYQLARVAEAIRRGDALRDDVDASVATAELVDECYRRAGLPLRHA